MTYGSLQHSRGCTGSLPEFLSTNKIKHISYTFTSNECYTLLTYWNIQTESASTCVQSYQSIHDIYIYIYIYI